MKNRMSAAPIVASPVPPHHAASTSWGDRLMLRILGLPTEEEAERILRSRPSFIASLTPEQIEAIKACEEFEVLGPANGPKRKF